MGQTRATVLVVIIVSSLTLTAPNSVAEDGGGTIIEGGMDFQGPAWLEFECLRVSCTGLELEIEVDGEEYIYSDNHVVHWSGFVDSTLSWEVNIGDDFDIGDIGFDYILPSDSSLVESGDLQDTVPVPGNQPEEYEIDATSACQLDRCEPILGSLPKNTGATFVGSLEDQEDKDAIRIVGDNGDVVVLDNFKSMGFADLEIWKSSSDSKSLHEIITAADDFPVILDYPQDASLWLRVVHPSDPGPSPYEIMISRFDDELEAPGGGDLEGQWNHGEHLEFRPLSYIGHISGFDEDGDSLLLQAGSKMEILPECYFNGDISLEILLKTTNGTISIYEQIFMCPDIIETPKDAVSLEFRISSNGPASWKIGISTNSANDGNIIGDAPDYLWSEEGPPTYHEPILPGPAILSGTLGPGDNVDVHVVNIGDENGSRVYIRDEGSSPVNFQIQSLDQENWGILNSTNGSIISMPMGTHAIRVERLASSDAVVEYRFTLIYAGEDIPDDAELSDLSYLFTDLYLFLGALMIVPLLIVIWWERKRLFSGSNGSDVIEAHERRRLRRLRERLSRETSEIGINEQEIESALHQLGDSPWAGIVSEWGDPMIRHLTEQIEVNAWGIDAGRSLILGIRVGGEDWKLAAIRFHSPEGAVARISEVSPKHLFRGDEVFLDTLESESKTFVRVTIVGNPSVLSFQLSGLVNGEPVAAAPRIAMDWQSLEEE
ncbi:MAG: hypothetical protein CMB53_03345 [Euryarchaeota archaeon]|nr:hypothetical protein [Euryarchaeota archaeon]|tara:strand:+ start:22803 stop:24950 length:2148 start_codon:yes stop_codon:yes gene_type:complete